MAAGKDYPRGRDWDANLGREAAADEPRSPARDQGPQDLQPPEELVADAGLRSRQIELTAELEQARAEEAAYEERYGTTFEEFHATYDPRDDPGAQDDYLAWGRAAERVRMLRHQLARLASSPHPRRAPAAPGEESGKRKRVS